MNARMVDLMIDHMIDTVLEPKVGLREEEKRKMHACVEHCTGDRLQTRHVLRSRVARPHVGIRKTWDRYARRVGEFVAIYGRVNLQPGVCKRDGVHRCEDSKIDRPIVRAPVGSTVH